MHSSRCTQPRRAGAETGNSLPEAQKYVFRRKKSGQSNITAGLQINREICMGASLGLRSTFAEMPSGIVGLDERV
jgi:hypothetical protein